MTTSEATARAASVSVESGKTMEFLGNQLRELTTGQDTGGAYTLIEYTARPAFQGPPPHVHAAQDEVTYVLDGDLQVRVGEHTMLAARGRGIPHNFSNPGTAPARFLEITLPAGIERYFEEVASLMATPSAGPPDLAALLPRIVRIAKKHGIQMGGAPPASIDARSA